MDWIIPGTTVTARRENADRIEDFFRPMFLTGGLTLSQVASLTGLEPYAIQNWVKRGFLSAPNSKRYDIDQVCRIITIHMLKGVLPLERITSLLEYINGEMDDTSDDLICDSELYFMFVKLASHAREIDGEGWNDALSEMTQQYREPVSGARERVVSVLRIMLTAWITSRLKAQVDQMIDALGQ